MARLPNQCTASRWAAAPGRPSGLAPRSSRPARMPCSFLELPADLSLPRRLLIANAEHTTSHWGAISPAPVESWVSSPLAQ